MHFIYNRVTSENKLLSDIDTRENSKSYLHNMHSSTFETYIDPSLFEKEKNIIKNQFPLYIGHEKLVPKRGDFYVLGHEQDARVLIR